MSKRKYASANTKPCPNPRKGERCPLCGGAYACLEAWRKNPKPANSKESAQ